MGKVIITEQELAKLSTSAAKLRKELLRMPLMALRDFLSHVTLRTGIRYSETVGELTGHMELGPYNQTRVDSEDVKITPRTLYTYLGSVVKEFDPNWVYQSIWGSNITKGDGLKTTDITQQVLAKLAGEVGDALYWAVWGAKRNADGTKTKDLFDGFDTIAAKEVEEIVEAQWKDLGMPETLWHCHVKEFGPLIVSIDSYGKNYFEEMKVEYNKRKEKEIECISKEVGFIK